MAFDHRHFLSAATASLGVTLAAPLLADQRHPPIARVIVDNDFVGDRDGLFQLAHHLLSRSVETPRICRRSSAVRLRQRRRWRRSARCWT